MTEHELAGKLSTAYSQAPDRDKALHMMLFAIEHANALSGHNTHTLCDLAGIPKWGPQLNLGKKLARHVTIK